MIFKYRYNSLTRCHELQITGAANKDEIELLNQEILKWLHPTPGKVVQVCLDCSEFQGYEEEANP